MEKRFILIALFVLTGLVSCNPVVQESSSSAMTAETTAASEEEPDSQTTGMSGRMGPGSGMMERHHATIPPEYSGKINPVEANETSLQRGAELYTNYCVNYHGDGGMGDGPAGQTLDPVPAPIAHTSRMLGDDYMFWRISEGGLHEPFTSAMPRWQDVMDEDDRWDVINYVRALGSGQITARQQMDGAVFDPEVEAAKHLAMTVKGVEQGMISQLEADTFLSVHEELDQLMADGMAGQSGSMDSMRIVMLEQMLNEGIITLEESVMFNDVHDRLMAAGLME